MLLKPESLSEACNEMFQGLHIDKQGKHIAGDGKKSRGCYDVKGRSLLNIVSAWDTANGISLGQIATKNDEGKEVGEFNAIPKLVNQWNVKDALVTVDAGGCYAEITDAIVAGGGDYAITLKENQPKLHTMTKEMKCRFFTRKHKSESVAQARNNVRTRRGRRNQNRRRMTAP